MSITAFRQARLSQIAALQLPRKITKQQTAAAMPIAPRGIQSGIAPYNGEWTHKQVIHLLKRTMFGASRSHIEQLLALSPADAVEALLTTPSEPAPPVNNYYFPDAADPIIDPNIAPGETWVNDVYVEDPFVNYGRLISCKTWWIKQMMQQELGLFEKMVLFWANHFGTQFSSLFEGRFNYLHLVNIRQHTFGNFKNMVRAITTDPQMLIYLNGAFSQAGEPDENYARELQELFCIGKSPQAQFTEEDVQEAARLLTGWTITDYNIITVQFLPFLHDAENKQFSAFYGNAIIEGQIGANGANELDQLLDLIFAQPETAKFICRKLYRFFVYHGIDEQTENEVIEPLAQIMRDNNYEILPVLRALFQSEHFFDEANRATLIKSPIDHFIGMFREFDMNFIPDDYPMEGWILGEYLDYQLYLFGQEPGDPPNVAGYPAYYQAPQYDKIWINTDTLPRRIQLTEAMLYYGYMYSDTDSFKIDPVAFAASLPNPEDPNALIQAIAEQMCIYGLSDEVKAHLKTILLYNLDQDFYWTAAWSNYSNNPDNEEYYNTVLYLLSETYRYMLSLEEYQLM